MNVELFEKVKAHILEEPKRLNMDYSIHQSNESPCGTTACIAGWAAILSGKITPSGGLAETGWPNVRDVAIQVLDIQHDAGILFYEHRWPRRFFDAYAKTKSKRKRAKIAADRIEHFIRTKGKE